MKKTVVLMASPHLQSNTDILAQRVMDGIRSSTGESGRIEKFDLVERQELCCACGQCREVGECLQFPQISAILREIQTADGIVLATPTWWLGPSSYLKVFMDHWGAFLRPDDSSRIAGKRAVIVACCGNEYMDLAEKVCNDLEKILFYLKVRVVGSLSVKGVATIGEIARDEDTLQEAFDLGVSLYKGVA